jgi:integrase
MPRKPKQQTCIPGFGFLYQPVYTRNGVKKRSAVWWMAYQTDDGQIRTSTEQTDRQAAYSALARKFGERIEGKIQHSSPERVTFGELFTLVEQDYKRRKLASISNLQDRIRKHLKPLFGDIPVVKLRKADVENFAEKATKKLSNATVNRCLSILRRALQVGADQDPPLVTRAIPKWFGKLDEDNVRTGFVTEEMYRSVMPHMAPHVRTAFCIGYHLGMRLGEILGLRWDQVDFAAGVITLEKRQTKGRKARTAPIYGDMRSVLEMAREICPMDCLYVIQEAGQRVQSIKTAYAAAWKRAQMLVDTGRARKSGKALEKPPVLFHDLRRTAATNMIRANVAPERILSIVGWKSMAMLRRYGILDESDAVAVGKQMEQFMGRTTLRESTKIAVS